MRSLVVSCNFWVTTAGKNEDDAFQAAFVNGVNDSAFPEKPPDLQSVEIGLISCNAPATVSRFSGTAHFDHSFDHKVLQTN